MSEALNVEKIFGEKVFTVAKTRGKARHEVHQIKNPNQYAVGGVDRLRSDRRDHRALERQWNR